MLSKLSIVPKFSFVPDCSVISDLSSCVSNNLMGVIEKQINEINNFVLNVETSINNTVDDGSKFIEIKNYQLQIKNIRNEIKLMKKSDTFEKYKKLLEIIKLFKQLETVFSNADLKCNFDSSKISKDNQTLYFKVISVVEIIQHLGFNSNLLKSFDDSDDGTDDGSDDGSDDSKSVVSNDIPMDTIVRQGWRINKTGKKLVPTSATIDDDESVCESEDDDDDEDDDDEDTDGENYKSSSNVCSIQSFVFNYGYETETDATTNYISSIVFDEPEDIEKATNEYIQILKEIGELINFVEISKGLYNPNIYAEIAEFKNVFEEKKADKDHLLKLKQKLQGNTEIKHKRKHKNKC